MGGLRDTEDQLDACRAQSVTDERRIAILQDTLDGAGAVMRDQARQIADLEATNEGLARQNTELEHDLARAETALADRLQHDAHARPALHTIDRDALRDVLGADWTNLTLHDVADRIAALVQSYDGVLLTPEEAALAARAARHSAESIRAVLDVDPTRLHPDVAGYVDRLNDLADRLQAGT